MANLPVPTLASEVANNNFTAALARASIYNTGTFLLNPPLFVGTQTVSQSVTTGAWTTITLDTTQVDTYGGHSNTVNNSRYTAQVAGMYAICGVSAFNTNTSGVRGARIHVNGAVIRGTAQMTIPATSSGTGLTTPVRTIRLNAGDYVELAGWQSSGGSLSTIVASDITSALWVCWAGT
jgi:hypothetical protein